MGEGMDSLQKEYQAFFFKALARVGSYICLLLFEHNKKLKSGEL